MSREHIISASQFDANSITVSGLPWCKEPKTVGLASLVAKNLCREHNAALSPVDNEMRRFRVASKTLMDSPTRPVRISLDARIIERWLLKTTINLARQWSDSGLEVTAELVRIAFGLATPPPSHGFFLVATMDEDIEYKNQIRFRVAAKDDRMVIAAFSLHGIRSLYAFSGAFAVKGAMRARQVNFGSHWLKFRWNPTLAPNDTSMSSLASEPDQ